MGIFKFLRYRIKLVRCSQPNSSTGAKKNFGRGDSLGKFFDHDEDDHHNKYVDDDDGAIEHLIREDGSVVRSFSWDEIARVTRNFSQVVGFGGFSNVYLARLPDATRVAIKIHSSTSKCLYRVFKQELDIFLYIRHHDHIVRFLGYYDDQEKGLLMLEYMENGTLHDKLQSGGDGLVLPWTKRVQIAYQMAQAIEYLHERCSPHIIHGDIKSSNILLDNNYDSKLCDFGNAKLGYSSTAKLLPCKQHQLMMTGSPGYVDLHYLRTGIATKKNDIYSFGVLLLELITGMEAFSAETGNMLTSSVNHATEVDLDMVDPSLNGNFDSEEATFMFSVAGLCLGHSPTLRPSASDIMFSMQHQIPSICAQSKLYNSL